MYVSFCILEFNQLLEILEIDINLTKTKPVNKESKV